MRRFDELRADQVGRGKNRTRTSDVLGRASQQLGTLGGGNHYIELCTDSRDRLWITLHSGSRGIGNLLGTEHIERAKADPRNEDLPAHLKELALFYKGTPEMDAYLHDLHWAQEYAMRSRTLMMALIRKELRDHLDARGREVSFADEINCHHNYASEEIVDGREMIVTRKGAISANPGESSHSAPTSCAAWATWPRSALRRTAQAESSREERPSAASPSRTSSAR